MKNIYFYVIIFVIFIILFILFYNNKTIESFINPKPYLDVLGNITQ